MQGREQNKVRLKDYVLGATLGKGAFSRVMAATHMATGEEVAIKIIVKGKISVEERGVQEEKRRENKGFNSRERVQKELRILRRVRHPNIIQLYEILEDTHHIYIVTELGKNGELFDHISRQGRLSEFEGSKLLQQLLDAVEYMHGMGIAHRDLKPQNILLDYKNNVKVTDFGLSNIYQNRQLLNTACGSPFYAAPQMLQSIAYDPLKADIWSVGVVLYAMCFGFLPFEQQQPCSKITQTSYQVPKHASTQLKSLLSKMLEVTPQKRATISAIRDHPFCKFTRTLHSTGLILGLSNIIVEDNIVEQMLTHKDFKQNNSDTVALKKQIIHNLKQNKHNSHTVMYYLLLQRHLRRNNFTMLSYFAEKDFVINRYLLIEKIKLNYYNRIKNYQFYHPKNTYNSQKHKTIVNQENSQKNQHKRRIQSCKKNSVNKKLFTPQKKNNKRLKKNSRIKQIV